MTNLEERDQAISTQWQRRIERARYDAGLAERRYEAVDPQNRLIASALEQRWNDAMQRLLDLEGEMATFQRQALRAVTAEQKRQILELGRNFPRLWAAPTTTAQDRKRMLRLLIKDVTIAKTADRKLLRAHIRWQGGAVETLDVRLPANRAEVMRYPEAFIGEVRELASRHDDDEIVALLNRDNRKSSTGKPFSVAMIRWIRHKHGIVRQNVQPGSLTVNEVCARYGVTAWVVYYWIGRGILPAQRKPGRPYSVTIVDGTDQRLQDWVVNSAHLRTQSSPTPIEQGVSCSPCRNTKPPLPASGLR